MVIDWLWAGYGLAVGYLLSMGWLWADYVLAINWLMDGYQRSID